VVEEFVSEYLVLRPFTLIAHYSIFAKIRPLGHRLKGKWQVAARARHRMEEGPGAGTRAGQRGQEAGSSGIALFLTTFE
jgi:hypothetical protein